MTIMFIEALQNKLFVDLTLPPRIEDENLQSLFLNIEN